MRFIFLLLLFLVSCSNEPPSMDITDFNSRCSQIANDIGAEYTIEVIYENDRGSDKITCIIKIEVKDGRFYSYFNEKEINAIWLYRENNGIKR